MSRLGEVCFARVHEQTNSDSNVASKKFVHRDNAVVLRVNAAVHRVNEVFKPQSVTK